MLIYEDETTLIYQGRNSFAIYNFKNKEAKNFFKKLVEMAERMLSTDRRD